MRVFRWGAASFMLLGLAGGAWLTLGRRAAPLPAGLSGTLVYVSDRSGMDVLYARTFPAGEERRLTYLNEPVREPAVSPDRKLVAFTMGGRIGVVPLAGGEARFFTLGVDWRDASPAWRSDGKALLVSARRKADAATADVHLLKPDPAGGDTVRSPLTDTPGLDEQTPIYAPLDAFAVFVREGNLFRLDFRDGRTRRLAGGFKKSRYPRLLPSGRLLCLWTEGKLYGIDVMDLDGKNRETLAQGTVYYRTVAPSPDGRFVAATFTFDLGFHPAQVLLRQREEVRLLDASGQPLVPLLHSWRHAFHSPDWR